MPKHKNAHDLTEAEIRSLLSTKLRSTSSMRLERYRRTGRRVVLVPDIQPFPLETLSTEGIDDEDPARGRLIQSRKRPPDIFLLVIELIAVVGFLYLIGDGIGIHHLLNRASNISLQQPTLTPTPMISAIILPSGHVHASLPSNWEDRAEIPEHLRPLVQPPANVPVPTPAPKHAVRIQIPAIDVDAPVVHGDDWEQLKKGVAHNVASANPGQPGNIVLSGHNDVFGEVFRYLEDLKPGDKIIVYTSQRSYTYIVFGWELVEPTQVEVMSPTPDATITLISCHPYLVDNHRIVVKGSLAG
jgi:sortase A